MQNYSTQQMIKNKIFENNRKSILHFLLIKKQEIKSLTF